VAEGDDAFISYSHAADARVATELERGLERLARPWNRLRAMSVFRDQTDLTLNPDLWQSISSRLDTARYLILLLTPESAGSHWVNREAGHWCDSKGSDHVLLVWTGGELAWDDELGDFSASSSAVPDALRRRFGREPLFLDLRWARDEPELSLRHSRFRSAVAQVAAPIRGVAPDELEGEDIRMHRRARRLARSAVAVVAALAIAASVAAVVAVRNAQRADRRAREAIARQVGLAALDLPASEIDRAFLMSLASGELAADDDPERFQPAQVLIGRYSRLDRLLHVDDATSFVNVGGLAIGDDGRTVAAVLGRADGSSALATWDGLGDRSVALPADAGGRVTVLDGDSDVIVSGGSGGSVRYIGADSVEPLAGRIVDQDPSSGTAWVIGEDGALALVALDDATALASLPGGTAPVVDINDGRAVAVTGGELSVYDVASGRRQASTTGVPAAATVAAGATTVVSASGDGSLRSWAVQDGRLVAGQATAMPSAVGAPSWMAVSTDGSRVLVAGTRGTALIELDDGSALSALGAGTNVIAADPSGRFVALGGSRLSVWDLDTGQRVFAVPQVAAALDWSGPCDRPPACKLVAAGVAIDVIDPVAETQVRLVEEVGAQAVAISGDGSTVVSGGLGPTVAVWTVRPSADDSGRQPVAAGELAAITPAAVPDGESGSRSECGSGMRASSPDGDLVAAVESDSAVARLCRADDGSRVAVAQLDTRFGAVTAVAVDDAGGVAVGRSAGFVEYYVPEAGVFRTGTAIDVRVGGEPVEVTAAAARGGVVVAGMRVGDGGTLPGRVVIWRLDRLEPTSFAVDYLDVAAVGVLDDEATAVIVAGRDTDSGPVTIQLWDTTSRRRVGRSLTGLSGQVVALLGSDSAVVGVDGAGRAYRWRLDPDPTREVCAIVGRTIAEQEWDEFADGALQRYAFDDPCPA
jgi:WD40 repeat protein